jgi:hypothetical protein
VFASAHEANWPSARTIATLIVHLTAVAWCFSGLGLAAAASSGRWITAFTSVALLLLVTYLLDYVAIGWRPARAVAWLSPFDYYPAIPILAGTAPVWRNLLVLWSATVVFVAIAYWRCERRDL